MPVFNYTAKSRDGAKKSGQVEAGDKRGAIVAVEALGFVPLVVTQTSASGAKKALARGGAGGAGAGSKSLAKGGKDAGGKPAKPASSSSMFKLTRPNHMGARDMLLFTGELCDLIDGGMTLGNALNCLANRGNSEDGPAQIVSSLRDSIIEGSTFSSALEKFPKIFGTIYINMIRAGEASGDMTGVLKRLISHFERQQETRAKVTGAMVYPCIVMVMGFGVSVFAVTVILPQFQTIFDQMGPNGLPPMTKLLLGISDWSKKYFPFVAVATVVGIIALRRWIKTPPGARRWDALKLKTPLIKGIVASAIYANFARTLQSLLENGVPILQALRITSQTCGNTVVSDALLAARDRVTDGTTISGPLAQSGIFPQTIIDLMSVGEQTGDMPASLGHIAKRYESDLNKNVAVFTTALEPIMIFVVAIIIAFIAVAVMQAVLSVSSGAGI